MKNVVDTAELASHTWQLDLLHINFARRLVMYVARMAFLQL